MTKTWIPRPLEKTIERHLQRGKSILLFGPRQTGKTSLLTRFCVDLSVNFLLNRTRLAYEKDPDRLVDEIEMIPKKLPLVLIDEAQKVPSILEAIQYLIDKNKAQFLITGSSARKLKVQNSVNLLPGRVVQLSLAPLNLTEAPDTNLEEFLLFGSLPGVYLEKDKNFKETDLASYVESFLDEEIRKEAMVRNIPAFARFLELAAIDSGKISNFSSISKQIGIAHTTIASHYQVLEDCLVVERFDPITESLSRKKLTRSSKYLFFDLGVRRLAANEGTKLGPERMGELFEQWVGLELRRHAQEYLGPKGDVRFWRDPDGPEVDWVLQKEDEWIPIEVKWSENPPPSCINHLKVFMSEYPKRSKKAFVICRTERARKISENVTLLPWHHLPKIFF